MKIEHSAGLGGGWPGAPDARGRPVVDPDLFLGNRCMARAMVPGVAGAELLRSWAAIVNGSDDWRPIIGEVPDHSGFFIDLSPWTGSTAGLLASLVTAELVTWRKTIGRSRPLFGTGGMTVECDVPLPGSDAGHSGSRPPIRGAQQTKTMPPETPIRRMVNIPEPRLACIGTVHGLCTQSRCRLFPRWPRSIKRAQRVAPKPRAALGAAGSCP